MIQKESSDVTRLEQAEQLLSRLLDWEQNVFGGSEAPVWDEAKRFMDRAEEETE